MQIFKKDKGEDSDDDQLARKKFNKKNSKVKAKRKEKEITWGKRERLFVLIVIFLTVGASGILASASRSWKLPGLPRLKLPSFTLPFIKEETIIIEREGGEEDRQRAEEVTEKFKSLTNELSGVYGLYVFDLGSGFSYGVNDKESFEPASLNKLLVMATVYLEAESGTLNLETQYTLKESDKVSGSGSLYAKPEGYKVSYRDLVYLMGKQSDNTAFNIVKKILGEAKVEELIDEIGMANTNIFAEDQKTTPGDIGKFFAKLWQGKIVSEKGRDEILESLTDTAYEAWIPEGIPDARVAHKFGREIHVVNDAGIVFAPGPEGGKPFVLVIMSKGVVEREADSVFPELARIVYEAERGS